ncbi:MAG: thioredoxin family protein [Thermoanaerobaculia bacterium]|nr:thioredoxin family protein [Thermoanaerobaculia bacterium]
MIQSDVETILAFFLDDNTFALIYIIAPEAIREEYEGTAQLIPQTLVYGEAAVAALRAEQRDVKVRVYFGSWCPFCKDHVPLLLRVVEELKGSKIRFEFYGLPRPFSGDAEATRDKVNGVPTGIVYVDGKEVGRLSTRGWQVPEVTLTELLRG